MEGPEELGPNEGYRIYVTPQAYRQLRELVDTQTTNFARLKKAVASAEPCMRPYEDMTRKERAQWVAETIMEAHGELVTLEDEFREWIKKLKNTSFANTGQASQVGIVTSQLRELGLALKSIRDQLLKLKFPGGWKTAEDFAPDKTLRKK